MNSLILSFLAFASTLAPTSASDYRYCVPPMECWPLVDGTGMGDTVSYRAIRYTDIAWLANATREFTKLCGDIFSNPRFYVPYLQVTNSLMYQLANPSGLILRPGGDYVNYAASASYAVPGFLDAGKSLSATVALPVGYGGNMQVAWPLIADVTASNRWQLSDRLFAALATNATSRIVRLSTITNAYDSIKKLHALKFVYGAANSEVLESSSGTTTKGREVSTDYTAQPAGVTVTWIQSTSATTNWTSSSIPLGGVGGFEFTTYAYSSKEYHYASDGTNGLSRSPLCTITKDFNFYPTFNANTSTPCTVVMNSCIGKVYSSDYQDIGYDAAWSARRGDFARVSCFRIQEKYEEYKAATGPSAGEHLSSTSTEYVLVDTSDWKYTSIAKSSPYIGQYALIGCGFFAAIDLVGFFENILGAERTTKLARSCDVPREAQNDGTGYPDYTDRTSRELVYKVSHVWSISTLKPNYTCTFDGN